MKRKLILVLVVTLVGIISFFLLNHIYDESRMNEPILQSTKDKKQELKSEFISEKKVEEKENKRIEEKPQEERIIDVVTTDEYRVIVNKKHALSSSYNPGEPPVAEEAFLKLKSDMQSLGFSVSD